MKRASVLVVVLLCASAVLAQHPNIERGVKPEKLYQFNGIDTVNLFNGNINLRIPVGPAYSLDAGLGYAFTLAYNSNVWDYQVENWCRDGDGTSHPVAYPSRRSNAGLGWTLSLGRLLDARSPGNDSVADVYEDPTGGDHSFAASLHGEPAYDCGGTSGAVICYAEDITKSAELRKLHSVQYTTDGTFIRKRVWRNDPTDPSLDTTTLDFPNGEVHTFFRGRLVKVEDAYGNSYAIDYISTDGRIDEITLTDAYDRVQRVYFKAIVNSQENYKRVVDRIVLTAHGTGAVTEYTFKYEETARVLRGPLGNATPTCADQVIGWDSEVTVPLLSSVNLSDGSSYVFTYYKSDDGTGAQGMIGSLTFPTRGRYEWKYALREMPLASCEASSSDPSGIPTARNLLSPAPGIAAKREFIPLQTEPIAVWQYEHAMRGGAFAPVCHEATGVVTSEWFADEVVATVWSPSVTLHTGATQRQKAVHYFSAWAAVDPSPNGYRREDYGLPFARGRVPDTTLIEPAGGRFLSSEMYQCVDQACERLRSTYLRYEGQVWAPLALAPSSPLHARVAATMTVLHDGLTDTWTDSRSCDYDGYGHYRTTTESTTVGKAGELPGRRTTSTFNPGTDSKGRLAGSSALLFGFGDPWVLNTFDRQTVSEVASGSPATSICGENPAASNAEPSEIQAPPPAPADVRKLEQYCFESGKGFLQRKRTQRSATEGPNDLVSVFTRDSSGRTVSESYYGGDNNPLPADFALCTGGLTSPPYGITHSYVDETAPCEPGEPRRCKTVLKRKSGYTGMVFRTADYELEARTGLPTIARDVGTLPTSYRYDPLGRITEIRPSGRSWLEYRYVPAGDGGVPAALTEIEWPDKELPTGQTSLPPEDELTRTNYYFDGLGRVIQQSRRMPKEWSTIWTVYDALGRKESATTPQRTSTGSYQSVPAAATATVWQYDVLGRVKSVHEADGSTTTYNYTGGDVERTTSVAMTVGSDAETPVKVTETHDGLGRLRAVQEPSADDGSLVQTLYTYDAVDRLTRVDVGVQQRTFGFDLAGLLVTEDHPEHGETKYKYDARGHVIRRQIGSAVNLAFDYDAAERLKEVRDEIPAPAKVLKSFDYGDTAGTATLGRLDIQRRYNPTIDTAQAEWTIVDDFNYEPSTGRVSTKTTTVGTSSGSTTFTQALAYTSFGAPNAITFPECSTCGSLPVSRTLPLQYSQKFLAGVTGVTMPLGGAAEGPGISYAATGAVRQVQRVNGVLETYTPDPDGMARPHSIEFTSAKDCSLILTQPADTTIVSGGTATFSVGVADGATVQWYEGKASETGRPVGDGSTTLTVSPVSRDTSYWALVSKPGSECVDGTTTVTAFVCQLVAVTSPSSDVTTRTEVAPLAEVPLSVEATGRELTYQWTRVRNGIRRPIPGDGPAIALKLDAEDTPAEGQTTLIEIEVVVSSSCAQAGPPVTRKVAILEVKLQDRCEAELIASLPWKLTAINVGQIFPLHVEFAERPNATYSFRWYLDGQLDRDYPNMASPRSDYMMQVHDATHVRVDAWITCGGVISPPISSESYGVLNGHCPVPKVKVVPEAAHAPTAPVTFTAEVDWPEPRFQWYTGEKGNTREPITAATAAQLTVGTQAGTYWVRVTTECGTYADSDAVAVSSSCGSPVRLRGEPASTGVAAGTPVTLSVDATSTPLPTGYQWHRGAGTVLLGETKPSLTVAPMRTTDYWVQVVNGCHVAKSRMARVHVTSCAGITFTQQPQDQMVDDGQSPQALVIGATASEPLQYQWYIGESGDVSAPIAGAQSATFQPPNAEARYWARISFADPAKCAVDSRTVTISLCRTPAVGAFVEPISSVPGLWQVIEVPVEGERLKYEWFVEDAGAWAPEPRSWFNAVRVNPKTTTRYKLRVTSDCAPIQNRQVEVDPITVSVCPQITGISTAKAIVMQGTSTTLTLEAVRADRIEWFAGGYADAVKIDDVGDGTLSIVTPELAADTTFWARVHSGNCYRDSDLVAVAVCTSPKIMWDINNRDKVTQGEFQVIGAHVRNGDEPVEMAFYIGDTGDVVNSTLVHWTSNGYGIQPMETTKYWARATKPETGCYSDTTTLIVQVCIPVITAQPQSAMIDKVSNAAASVALSVTATPDNIPLQYQWYIGQPGDTSNPITGATTATYHASPDAATTYWVRVTGTCDISRDSEAATVTLCAAPTITRQPEDVNAPPSFQTTISIEASGTDLAFQWYVVGGDGGSTPIDGATASARMVSVSQTTDFWVRITGRCGTVDSNRARVSVPPVITSQPVGGIVMPGNTKELSVSATGTHLTYQWFTGSPDAIITGATSATYTPPPPGAATTYFCRVSSGNNGLDSDRVTLSLCGLAPLRWQTATLKVRPGHYQVLAIDGSPSTPHTYAWYKGAAGDTSNAVSSQASLGIAPEVTTSYWVRVTETDTACYTDSSTLTIEVCIPAITTQPAATTTIDKTSNPSASATLTVTADIATVSYQWYIGQPGDTSSPIAGATAATYYASPNDDTTYWARVSGTCGAHDDSSAALVIVCKPPQITRQPESAITPANFTTHLIVEATGTELAYQWYRFETTGASTLLPSGTSATLTVSPAVTTDYRVRVTGRCGTIDSVVARLSVAPTITTQPVGGPITKGTTRTLNVAASGTYLTYQWYIVNGTAVSPIAGATGTSYTTPPLDVDTSYFCRVQSGAASADSAAAVLTVCQPRSITVSGSTVSGAQRILSVVDATADESYEWYRGATGDTSALLSNSASYAVYPLETTQYWLRTKRAGCDADSPSITAWVCFPKITTQPAAAMVNAGTQHTLTVGATGTAPLSYQWYVGDAGVTTNPIAGATRSSYTTPPLTSTTTYWARVSPPSSGCSSGTPLVAHGNGGTVFSPTAIGKNNGSENLWSGGVHSQESIDIGAVVSFRPNQTNAHFMVGLNSDPATNGSYDTIDFAWYPRNDATLAIYESAVHAGDFGTYTPSTVLAITYDGISVRYYKDGVLQRTVGRAVGSPLFLDSSFYTQQSAAQAVDVAFGRFYVVTLVTDGAGGTIFSPDSIGRNGGTANSWSGGVHSQEGYGHGAFVSFRPNQTTMHFMVGLNSDPATNGSYDSIDFAWYGRADGIALIYESGNLVQAISGYTTSTRFAIAYDGANVRYYLDGTVYRTVARSGGGAPLYMDSSFYAQQATPQVVQLVFGRSSDMTLAAHGDGGTIFSPASIGKNNGTANAWSGGVHSEESYRNGASVSFRPNQTSAHFMVGLNADPAANGSYDSIDYAWYVRADGIALIYESGALVQAITGYTTSTVFAITYDGADIRYYLDGVPYRTVARAVGSPLFMDSSFYSQQSTPQAVQVVFGPGRSGGSSPNAYGSVDSAAATVAVCHAPQITRQPASTTTPANFTTYLTVEATGTDIQYQWYRFGADGTATLLPSGTTATISFSISVTTEYFVRITGSCGAIDSAIARISVAPTITTQPVGGPITKGTSRTLTVAASGTYLSYQWYAMSGSTPSPVSGATGTSYTTPAIDTDASYFCRVNSGAAYTDSATAVLAVCQPRSISVSGSTVSGSQRILSVVDASADESYEWYRGSTGNTSALVSNSASFAVYPLETTQYWLRTKRAECHADSPAITAVVCYPSITTQPAAAMITSGSQKTLSVAATGTQPLTYQWYVGSSGVTTSPIAGATAASYTTPPLTSTTTYWVRVSSPTSSGCSSTSVDSTTATVAVCQPPSITTQPASTIVSVATTVDLTVAAAGDGLSYAWYRGYSGDTTYPVGTNSSTLSVYVSSTVRYWVRVTGTCGTVDSNTALLSVPPRITSQPVDTTVCYGSPVTMSVTASGTELAYQWYRQVSGYPTETLGTTQTITFSVTQAPVTVWVVVKSGDASTQSYMATVTTNPSPTVHSITSAQFGSYYELKANVASYDAAYVDYKWYRGALGNTSALISSGSNSVLVLPSSLPATYWVSVFYVENSCATNKAITIQ